MTKLSGIQALVNMLVGSGVEYVFGNPGTTELPLVDILAQDTRLKYILGLHEVPVMSMADGYSQASGKLGVVNLHISCGLGNAMGMLYNAFRAGTPLLVTAGQTDRRLIFEEPILWSDMAAIARPWTKWSVEVNHVRDLPAAIRRAVQAALTPPTGPVFLSLPVDLQMELAEFDQTMPAPLDRRVRPPRDALKAAAKLLAGAKNPCLLVGSRLVESDATREAVRLAEILGAPAFTESGTTHGRGGFPSNHPLYGQALPLWSPEVRERLAGFDVALVAGMDLLRQYMYFEPARAMPEHLKLVHLDENPWQIGKNYPVEVGLIGDPKAGLADLIECVQAEMSVEAQSAAEKRRVERTAQCEKAKQSIRARADAEKAIRPLTPLAFMATLARALPPDAAVVEEAVSTTSAFLERAGALGTTDGYFGHRGWALGWGMGCALGVKLAWPDRPVLAVLGDGSTMYGIQGLWTAAHYNLPVTFVVSNNAQYQILKVGGQHMGLPAATEGKFVGLDLTHPEIDLVGLAQSMGVAARRVSEPDELATLVRESLSANKPQLFDVAIQRGTPPRLAY